jgi:hypothetical protein
VKPTYRTDGDVDDVNTGAKSLEGIVAEALARREAQRPAASRTESSMTARVVIVRLPRATNHTPRELHLSVHDTTFLPKSKAQWAATKAQKRLVVAGSRTG